MAVAVHFPDGSIREAPGQLSRVPGDGPLRYEQVPLNHDSAWRFERRGQQWIAKPRLGHMVSIRAAAADWWSDIDPMRDLEQVQSQTGRTAA